MGLRHALTALAEQWDDVRERLSPGEFDEVQALVDAFTREGDRVASEELAEDIADLLRARLPRDHPFLVALRAREERFAPDAARRAVELSAWFSLTGPLQVRLGRAPGPTSAEVEREAESWLLDAPALDADQLRARGVDPGDPGLIRLDRADGDGRWPAFQFAAGGGPLRIVLEINRILAAADDPYGAADWWLGGNGRLGDAPARLIGSLPDDELIAAARAETGGA
ncbi:hypothetical protein E1287_01485 [Actinomadura sp. KC06]|uniref:hypothetical protein n=1 Tax=Actinomadura sp. KC06 TaxID=2530369 RepID=UPI00104ACF08|nr:hypothetical protein [Actinomadura sp. KC06]TDD40216.1 hypothetical protein E1287_01485 [Actinomadura sp. KC06]